MSSRYGDWFQLALRQVVAESYLDAGVPPGVSLFAPEVLLAARLVHGGNPPGVELGNSNRLTPTLAGRIAASTEVLAQYGSDASGFSATLMRDRASGSYQLAIRGTEFQNRSAGGDWERDGVPGADGELALHGVALAQLDALSRIYELWRVAFSLADAPLVVTGYSLGGHLALGLAELHPEQIDAVVTFNAPSRGDWSSPEATLADILSHYRQVLDHPGLAGPGPVAHELTRHEAVVLEQQGQPLDADNIYHDPRHRYAVAHAQHEFGMQGLARPELVPVHPLPPAVTNIAVAVYGHAAHGDVEIVSLRGVPVPAVPVLIEDQPNLAGLGGLLGNIGSFGHTHSLALLTDALRVHDLYARIDPALGPGAIQEILAAVSGDVASDNFGPDERVSVEASTLERGVDALARLILGDDITPLPYATGLNGYGDLAMREALHARAEAVLAARIGGPAILLTPIVNVPVAELVAQAAESVAWRHALWSLAPFVATGDAGLYSDPLRSERLAALSPVYLEQRAEFVHRLWERNLLPDAQHLSSLQRDYIDLTHGAQIASDFTAAQTVFGSAGSDRLAGLEGADFLFGDAGADWLTGGASADYLEGGLGDDWLDGGGGADQLLGGAGWDVYNAGSGDTILDSDGRGSVLYNGRVLGPVYASATPGVYLSLDGSYRMQWLGADLKVSLTTAHSLLLREFESGDFGIQLLPGRTALNPWRATTASEVIELSEAGSHVQVEVLAPGMADPRFFRIPAGKATTDTRVASPVDAIRADAGDDYIVVRSIAGESFTVWGGSGNDSVSFSAAVQGPVVFIYGEAGDDGLTGSAGPDRLDGGSGSDALHGAAGDDSLSGGSGADLLSGGDGHDVLDAGFDGDWLLGGAGHDLLLGSNAADWLYGDTTPNALVWVNQGLRPALDLQYWTPVYGKVEGSFAMVADVPSSLHGQDRLFGGLGDDALFGGGGDDLLSGGSQDDRIYGEGGDDLLQGDEGNDILWGDYSHDQYLTDNAWLQGLLHYNTPELAVHFHWRNYAGASMADGADRLEGGPGDDLLYGGDGDDSYVFGRGDGLDHLFDRGGRDRLLLGDRAEAWLFQPERNDLVVRTHRHGLFLGDEAIVIEGWFADAATRVEEFQFSDGLRWMEADIRAAIPTQQSLLPGFVSPGLTGGSYFSIDEILASDQVFRLRDPGGFDWLSIRRPTVLDAMGRRLGLGRTAIDFLERRGDDLDMHVLLTLDPTLTTDGTPVEVLALPPESPSPPAQFSINIVVEDYFTPAGRVEAILLDSTEIGARSAAPKAGAAALEAYANVNEQFVWSVPAAAFTDTVDDLLSYSLARSDGTALPAWLEFDPRTAELRGRPGADAAGWHALAITATDLGGSSATRSYTLNVGMNVAPELTLLHDRGVVSIASAPTLLEGLWEARDRNAGDVLRYAITTATGQALPWAGIDPDSGALSLMPGLHQIGQHELRVTVMDAAGLVDAAVFRLTVAPPEAIIEVTGSLQSAAVNPAGSVLVGGVLQDMLRGGPGIDLLQGGWGDDWIDGGGGGDQVHLESHTGFDTLVSHGTTPIGVHLGPGLSVTDAVLLVVEVEAQPMLRLQFSTVPNTGLNLPGVFQWQSINVDGETQQLLLAYGTLPELLLSDTRGQTLQFSALLRTSPGGLPGLPWYRGPADSVFHLDGPDRIVAGAADDVIHSGSDDDRIYAGAGNDVVDAGNGDDMLYGQDGADRLLAGPGRDRLQGGAGEDFLAGGPGDDQYWFSSGSGADIIEDAAGLNELALLGTSIQTMRFEDGTARLGWEGGELCIVDALNGLGIQRVAVYADADGDPLWSRDLRDLAREFGWTNDPPEASIDYFHWRIREGQSLLPVSMARFFSDPDGEALKFSLELLQRPSDVADWLVVDAGRGLLGSGSALAAGAGQWRYTLSAEDAYGERDSLLLEIEVVDARREWRGTPGPDHAVAAAAGGVLNGLAGDDYLLGGAGADRLIGGPGQDRLEAGAGDDLLVFSPDRLAGAFDRLQPVAVGESAGGPGHSLGLAGRWLSLDSHDGGQGRDTLVATEAADALIGAGADGVPRIQGIESFLLLGGDDVLDLRSATDTRLQHRIDAGHGDDWVHGGAERDVILGGTGDDVIWGAMGQDEIHGGPGHNTLIGGPGDDGYAITAGSTNLIADAEGHDTVYWLPASTDVQSLRAGLAGGNLMLEDAYQTTRVELQGWFDQERYSIDEWMRADGARLASSALHTWLQLRMDAAASGLAVADLAAADIPEALWQAVPTGSELPGFMS